jgi:hypothetical protein
MKAVLLAGVVAALAGVNGVAAGGAAIRAKIPFEFMVGDRLVPAGEYLVTRDGARNAVQIVSLDSGAALAVSYLPTEKNRTGFRHAVLFHKYGDRHFLREVWTGETEVGVRLPISRAEKEQMSAHSPVKTTLTADAAR